MQSPDVRCGGHSRTSRLSRRGSALHPKNGHPATSEARRLVPNPGFGDVREFSGLLLLLNDDRAATLLFRAGPVERADWANQIAGCSGYSDRISPVLKSHSGEHQLMVGFSEHHGLARLRRRAVRRNQQDSQRIGSKLRHSPFQCFQRRTQLLTTPTTQLIGSFFASRS